MNNERLRDRIALIINKEMDKADLLDKGNIYALNPWECADKILEGDMMENTFRVAATDRFRRKETGVIYKIHSVDWGGDRIEVVEVETLEEETCCRVAHTWYGKISLFLEKFVKII